jgi:hypothetical protein
MAIGAHCSDGIHIIIRAESERRIADGLIEPLCQPAGGGLPRVF